MPGYLVQLIDVALIVHVLLIVACLWRVWTGRTPLDRLVALDLISTLVIAFVVLIAIRQQWVMLLDVGLGLAAASFATTILLAKHVTDRQRIEQGRA